MSRLSTLPIILLLSYIAYPYHTLAARLHFRRSSSGDGTPDYFAVCAAVRDRPEYIREWVDYHTALGVDKFYLFDTDNPEHELLQEALQDHIDSGKVELYDLPRVNPRTVPMMQVTIYDICLTNLREKHQFIGFWDVDEFLVPRDSSIRFPDFLVDYEDVGALAVNWQYLGSSGHVTRPATGGMLGNYISCTPPRYKLNYQIKSIVNTRYAVQPNTDPHSFSYSEGETAVDVEGREVQGAWSDHAAVDRLALFHYAVRSLADFRDKMKKGSAMGNRRREEYFHEVSLAANETCTEALDLCRKWGLSDWCP